MDVTKLIRYTHAARRAYLKTLGELPWEEVVKDRGASFSSIRNIFLHALDAEDMTVNYIIPGKPEGWVKHAQASANKQDYGKFTDVSSIEKHVEEVEKKVDAYLAGLTQQELDRKIRLPWRLEPPIILRVEDILVEVTIENASHMGELIAILWQIDKQPPYLGWSFFLEQST